MIDKSKNICNIFDLDGTLYQTHKYDVYDQLCNNIYQYISTISNLSLEESYKLSEYYQDKYGSSVLGLMKEKSIDPEDFLKSAYKINYSKIRPDQKMKSLFKKIKTKNIVFTNSTYDYAETVLSKIEILDFIDEIFCIRSSRYESKPNKSAYDIFEKKYQIKINDCNFIDDREGNIKTAIAYGANTIHCQGNIYEILSTLETKDE